MSNELRAATVLVAVNGSLDRLGVPGVEVSKEGGDLANLAWRLGRLEGDRAGMEPGAQLELADSYEALAKLWEMVGEKVPETHLPAQINDLAEWIRARATGPVPEHTHAPVATPASAPLPDNAWHPPTEQPPVGSRVQAFQSADDPGIIGEVVDDGQGGLAIRSADGVLPWGGHIVRWRFAQ